MSKKLKSIFVNLISAIALCACSSAPRIMHYEPDSTLVDRRVSWPADPAEARLEYVGQLLGESNFSAMEGGADGAGMRLLRWIAGLGQNRAVVRQLMRPQSGVVDDSGRIFVTDAGIPGVMVFNEHTAELTIWRDAAENQPFVSPIGIAIANDGSFLIADSALGFVARLSADGEPLERIGADVLVRPTGVAANFANGQILVADTPQDNIKVFNTDGELVATLGKSGTAPGEFNGPTHLAFDNDTLYVTDTLNARVQIMTAEGVPLSAIGDRGLYVGNLVRPKGVTIDSDGNVYIVESYFDHLLIFDDAGQLLLPIGGSGKSVGRFFLPAGAWSDATGRIFIADMFNGRVVILRYLKG
jgi:DNA-binding beta-propeller fold protein YncE